jgi:hypothetical protein
MELGDTEIGGMVGGDVKFSHSLRKPMSGADYCMMSFPQSSQIKMTELTNVDA